MLGDGTAQQRGPEAGLQQRARQPEIRAYYDDILHRRFVGVITSYSIHYTKLYEVHDRGPGGRDARRDQRAVLRLSAGSRGVGGNVATHYSKVAQDVHRELRITSYNVCYTKLLRPYV